LRTPLNAIKGISDLLQFDTTNDEKNELLFSLKKSSQHLLNMVNDFLDFSKLKEGKLTLRRHPFQLLPVLKTAINLLKVNADEKGIDLILETNNLPDNILADESRLLQIIVNVVGNAIKFTTQGSVKLIANAHFIDENKCNLELKIIDTGIGISSEKIKLIFEDYQQADENIAATFGGTGLGLGICKRLIEQHQGSIICESELGKGTTFTIHIPYEYLKIESLKIEETNFDFLIDKTVHILIADDTAINVLVADKLIQRKMPKAVIYKAVNGIEALDIVKKNTIDIILMDIIMPLMDGYETTEEIRKLNWQPAPYIIAMSAGIGEDIVEKCYYNGMNDFLPKPYNPDALYGKIKAVVESRNLN
jgi:CheY-like chemotaxis protein